MQLFYLNYCIFSRLDVGESEKITTRENGKIALYKYKDFLQRKSEEQDREEYCERVRKVLAMPTVSNFLERL